MTPTAAPAESSALQRRVAETLALEQPVSTLQYASGKRLAGLARFDISTIGDLITHYPFRYNDFSRVVPIALASLSEKESILGTIYKVELKRPRARLSIVEVTLTDDSGMCIASWFIKPGWQGSLKSV